MLLTLGYTGLICLALEILGQSFQNSEIYPSWSSIYLLGLISPIYLSQTTGAFVQNPKEINYAKFSQTISQKDFLGHYGYPINLHRELWIYPRLD